MITSKDHSVSQGYSNTLPTIIAWSVTLLVSSLIDIVWFEIKGTVPIWLLWIKISFLGVLNLLSWFYKPLKSLRPFFVMLLAITSLMRLNTWILSIPEWIKWQNTKSFTVVALTAQLFEIGVSIILIILLFFIRKNHKNFFLVIGNINAKIGPFKWLGEKSPGPLWRFGLIFTSVVILGQFFMFILPLSINSSTLRYLIPFIPVILLLAATNSFTEEITLRAAPISTVYEIVGKTNAIWMAAILFGLSHYIDGIPSGIFGVLITTFLGWFFGKCLLDSQGFFWPWLFHLMQDILPFTMMYLNVNS